MSSFSNQAYLVLQESRLYVMLRQPSNHSLNKEKLVLWHHNLTNEQFVLNGKCCLHYFLQHHGHWADTIHTSI